MRKTHTPIKEISATGDASRGKSAKPSLMQQAMNVFLPIAVVSLFLWWFCTIPPSAPPPALPNDWTPGCPEMAGAWQSLPASMRGEKVRVFELDIAQDRWQWLVNSPNRREVWSMRLSDGDVLATSPYPVDARLLQTTRHIAMTPIATKSLPHSEFLDRFTLQPSGEVQFSSETLPPVLGLSAFSSLIARPDGSWRGILIYEQMLPATGSGGTAQTERRGQQYWVQASADGVITDFRLLDCPFCVWHASPPEAPDSFLATNSLEWNKGAIASIDLDTGLPRTLEPKQPADPDADHAAIELSLLERRLSPLPITRHTFQSKFLGPDRLPRLEAEMSILYPFLAEQPAPESPWPQQLRSEFARLRYQAWQQTHSSAELLNEAAMSLQVDGVTLHRGAESSSGSLALTGELRDSIAYEIRHAYLAEYSLAKLSTVDAAQIPHATEMKLDHPDCETSLRPLPDGGYLVVQVLRHAPATIGLSAGVLRIGRLSGDGSELTWVGWRSLATWPERPQIMFYAQELQVEIAGNHLLLAFSPMGGKIKPHQDLPAFSTWISLPLPAELTDLPEGPVQ